MCACVRARTHTHTDNSGQSAVKMVHSYTAGNSHDKQAQPVWEAICQLISHTAYQVL